MPVRPQRGDAADYYFTYIDQVPDGDVVEMLDAQGRAVVSALRAIPEARSRDRYAPGKWSIKAVVGMTRRGGCECTAASEYRNS